MRLRVGLVLIVGLCLARPIRGDTADARTIADAVVRAMKFWSVPGAAVVIVRDDKVTHLAGYGVRETGKKALVTPDTLFPLGSCGKAFTTAAMAGLVDDKKLHWDDRVRKHLDWFRLSDPLADGDVRLRDLACHRTGVASHDAQWYRAPWKPEETARRACKLPLAKPFRTVLQYQSALFTACGLAAAKADGRPWPEMIRKRLLAPLQMKDTTLDTASTLERKDVAVGHDLDGDPRRMARYVMEADPAGSIHSTARDLAKWLRFHLSGGLAEGKRVISTEALSETHSPQIVIRLSALQRELFPDTVQMSYGLGWVIYDHRGVRLVTHGGAIDGFRTQILLAPERKLGIAVLSNLHQTPMNLALAHTLLDEVLKLKKRDWNALHRATLNRLLEADRQREKSRLARREHGTKPSREPGAYAGVYEHPAYGTARITRKGRKLFLDWRGDESELEHFHYDTFTTRSDLTGTAAITFAFDTGGAVDRFAITGHLGIEFRRVARKKTGR
jgi:CubicO group peptidase (beta-lactamase class C family)